jgi:hypothetical protein
MRLRLSHETFFGGACSPEYVCRFHHWNSKTYSPSVKRAALSPQRREVRRSFYHLWDLLAAPAPHAGDPMCLFFWGERMGQMTLL